ncbi:ABC transporter, transmembrane domain, type 1 [Ophiocordyceps sinensis CO18]|uniref:ABC transporter, transmembrane domain, type 1 n=1 Tax=Ophiocordyceps sinensis (strain Co18 / CGMCC 3.14243) TaxID=911162 RepID=T5AIM1_OPHSC|nr:ABC transporter, transmembrane domain, type 1 [Ophiocordyceps sinensis CO18]
MHHLASLNVTADDTLFGPQLQGNFDFTLLFQQTILSILPSSLFLVASSAYLSRLLRKPICVRAGALLWAKLAVVVALVGIQLARTALWSSSVIFRSDAALAAASLSCLDALCMAAVLLAEHRHSPRPSTLLSVHLSLGVLFDVAMTRSCFRRHSLYALGCLSIVVVVLKMAILLLEEVSKKSLVHDQQLRSSLGRESTSGFWSRSLFLWLNSTLCFGFRSIMSVGDLQDLGPELRSERLFAKFQPFWGKANKSSPYCLPRVCLRTLAKPFLATVIPRLCHIGFKFAQPFLLQSIVKAVGERNLSRDTIGGLAGATVLVYTGIATTKAYYMHLTYRIITRLRGLLVSAIFDKTIKLKASDTANKLAAMTLMSTDIDGLENGLAYFHDIWASIIELALGIYFLAMLVGGASFLVVLPGLVTTAASIELARRMAPARVAWNEKVQARVSATSDVLSHIKGIKMMGLVPNVSEYIHGLRVIEVDFSKKLRTLLIFMHAIASFSTSITPVVVVAGGLFWTKFSGGLDAAQVFSTLSIIALVSNPLVMLLLAYPSFAGIMGCLGRMQSFLVLEERTDRRVVGQESAKAGKSHLSSSKTQDQNLELRPLHNMTDIGNIASEHCAVRFLDASIAVADGADLILHQINVDIAQSSLVMVVGPVGSGKSTLFKAILGEMPLCKGAIHVEHRCMAYCGQTPWLRNVSLRDNIISQSFYDPSWYNCVLRACLLDEDMQQFADGDGSLAGSGGVNLSGGQRQRMALARAVYARKPMLILDDVFSALDGRTAQAVFLQLLGRDGLLRKLGTTVVMTTHSVEHLALADKILVLDGTGSVREQRHVDDSERQSFVHVENRDTTGTENVQSQTVSRPSHTASAHPSTIVPPVSEEDGMQRQRGDVTLYVFYIKSIGKLLFALWLCTVAVSAVSDKIPQIFIRIWLERDVENSRYFTGYAVLSVASLACTSGMLGFYLLKLVPKSAEKLHRMLLDSVMKFSQDMTLVSQVLPMAFMEIAYLALSVLTDIGIIASGAKFAAIIIPFLLVALYFLQRFYLRTSRQIRLLDLEAKSPLYTQFTETAAGLQHVRAFGWQSENLSVSFRLLDYSQKPYYYMFCIQRWLALTLDLSVLAIAVVLVTFGLNTTTSQSAIGLALVNVMTLSETLSQLINSWIDLETSLGAIARLRTFLDKTPAEEDWLDEQDSGLPSSWPGHGKIEVRSMSAKYNPTDEASRPILNDLSVVIEPGQRVGIIGRTGSGKSSLLASMLGLLDYSGSVWIDGIDISTIPRQQLRSRITTLPQEPVQLAGTVRANLDPLGRQRPASAIEDDAMEEALVRVGLWKHMASCGGLDAELAAVGLSHGQRQLLCLARAMVHNAATGSKVVLVDEATSNLDDETEARVQAVLSEAFAGCTMLVVAHRLETIRGADVVLELKDGLLVAVTNKKSGGSEGVADGR